MDTTYAVFACYSKACAPPPVGKGGSAKIGRKAFASAGKGLHEPDSGFTMTTKLKPVSSGFAVALKGSDRLINAKDAYLKDGSVNPKFRELIRERIGAAVRATAPAGTTVAIGGWHNPADGKLEVNVTVVFPPNKKAAAIKFAKANDQIAIARLHDPFAIIDTGGTGGDRSVTASGNLVQTILSRAKVLA